MGSAGFGGAACHYGFGQTLPQVGRSGLDLESLQKRCRQQLFDEYLPFWELGGIDEANGGFMCYLYDDGSVENDRKDIWYQGRGIWVYSYLYNQLEKDPKWLAIARDARNFMVKHMHRGDGTWLTTVDRKGVPVGSIAIDRSNNVYGALFAAVGLIQYAKATRSEKDLELARLAIRKSVERYEQADYLGVTVPGVNDTGLRAQGHSFMFVWVLPQLLELAPEPWIEELLQKHLLALQEHYWNPEFGISNEYLFHDYSRIPSQAGFMVPGHSIEAQWMAMHEAARQGNRLQRDIFKNRMHRLIEMSWDYVFGGTCDTAFYAESTEENTAGPVMDVKTMWAQSEVVVGCLLALEASGESWAQEWFEKSWTYLQKTMTTDTGVWRQAVDRRGRDKQRDGISKYRRGNFHQPRCLMYMIEILGRMKGKL